MFSPVLGRAVGWAKDTVLRLASDRSGRRVFDHFPPFLHRSGSFGVY